jgi:hypothetical protein
MTFLHNTQKGSQIISCSLVYFTENRPPFYSKCTVGSDTSCQKLVRNRRSLKSTCLKTVVELSSDVSLRIVKDYILEDHISGRSDMSNLASTSRCVCDLTARALPGAGVCALHLRPAIPPPTSVQSFAPMIAHSLSKISLIFSIHCNISSWVLVVTRQHRGLLGTETETTEEDTTEEGSIDSSDNFI